MADKTKGKKYSIETEDVANYSWLYFAGLGLLTLVWLAIAAFFAGYNFTVAGETLNGGYLTLVLAALHFTAGLRWVDAQRIGGIFFLGMPTLQVSGIVICVPLGPFIFKDFSILTEEMEIPAEPRNIWRGEESPPADRPELRPPIRITFNEGEDVDDPLQRRVTEEVSFFVRLRIKKFFNFYIRIGSIEEARRQLEDIGVNLLAQILPGKTLSQAIKQISGFSESLYRTIEDAREGWGVEVVTARVKQFSLSRSLNSAVQEMAQSSARKKAAVITATGTERVFTLEGKGRANAVRLELNARTDGMKKMAGALKVPEKLIVGTEAARSIGQAPSDKFILGAPGLRELAGLGVAIAETAKDNEAGGTEEKP